jgi:hypothetical protein
MAVGRSQKKVATMTQSPITTNMASTIAATGLPYCRMPEPLPTVQRRQEKYDDAPEPFAFFR